MLSSDGASGNHELSYWKNPHLHITYYDYEYPNDNSITMNNEGEITFKGKIKEQIIGNRKNPFIHDSENRKPRKDLKGNIV